MSKGKEELFFAQLAKLKQLKLRERYHAFGNDLSTTSQLGFYGFLFYSFRRQEGYKPKAFVDKLLSTTSPQDVKEAVSSLEASLTQRLDNFELVQKRLREELANKEAEIKLLKKELEEKGKMRWWFFRF